MIFLKTVLFFTNVEHLRFSFKSLFRFFGLGSKPEPGPGLSSPVLDLEHLVPQVLKLVELAVEGDLRPQEDVGLGVGLGCGDLLVVVEVQVLHQVDDLRLGLEVITSFRMKT